MPGVVDSPLWTPPMLATEFVRAVIEFGLEEFGPEDRLGFDVFAVEGDAQ